MAQTALMRFSVLRRNDEVREAVLESLLLAPAEDVFRLLVPVYNFLIGAHSDDRVERVFKNDFTVALNIRAKPLSLLLDDFFLPIEVGEDGDFGAQNLRLDRLVKIIDRTGRISS